MTDGGGEGGAPPRGSSAGQILASIFFVMTSMVAIASALGWLTIKIGAPSFVSAGIALAAAVALLVMAIRGRGHGFRVVFEISVLGVLMVWGMAINHGLPESCTTGGCDDDYRRYLAEPEVFGLAVLHIANVVAYAISRRRPEALRGWEEALVLGSLLVGLLLQAVLTVQFGIGAIIIGILLSPVGMPAVAPLEAFGLYGFELVTRLRRRGREAAKAGLVPPFLSWPHLGRAAAASPLVLGVHR